MCYILYVEINSSFCYKEISLRSRYTEKASTFYWGG